MCIRDRVSCEQQHIAEELDPELARTLGSSTDDTDSRSSKSDDEIIQEVKGCVSILFLALLEV